MSWLDEAEVTTAAEKDRSRKDRLINQIESQRKEQERQGVIYNGLRYAGHESNRNALAEAQDMAEDSGMTSFPRWKDSDGNFHSDVPVDDVISARRQIGQKRMALIEKEGQYKDQVEEGTLTDVTDLNWEIT